MPDTSKQDITQMVHNVESKTKMYSMTVLSIRATTYLNMLKADTIQRNP